MVDARQGRQDAGSVSRSAGGMKFLYRPCLRMTAGGKSRDTVPDAVKDKTESHFRQDIPAANRRCPACFAVGKKYRFNQPFRSGKGIAFMNSLFFRFFPLHVCWLASFGIILKYRSPLGATAFVALLLLVAAGTGGTLVLLRKLPAGRLWLFYITIGICCVCHAFFILAAGRNTSVLILGGLPFALLLVPVLVSSFVFMMETGAVRIRAMLAAICFHVSCLPILILATLLMAF